MKTKQIKGKSTKLLVIISLCFMFALLMTSFTFGLGLMPASQSVLLGRDSGEFSLRIVNNDRVDQELRISVQGELAEYVSVDRDSLFLPSSQDHALLNVKVDVPSNKEIKPGEHLVRIIVTDVSEGTSEVSAKISLAFRLTIIVPYDGSYLDVTIFAPNFDKTKGGNFIIQATNLGSENAVNVVPIVDIYSSTNTKIATLRGEEQIVRRGETINVGLPLSEELESGRYSAKASLVYSGVSTTDEKVFTVGSPEIAIDSISAMSFRLGGVAGFDIFLINQWGEDIRGVYADVEFRKDNELLEETTTATVNIPAMGRSRLQAYWDTTGMTAGIYDLVINLNYLGTKKTETQQIMMEADKITMIGTGRVVRETEKIDGTGLLIVAVLFLVIINLFLIYKFVIKRKEDKK